MLLPWLTTPFLPIQDDEAAIYVWGVLSPAVQQVFAVSSQDQVTQYPMIVHEDRDTAYVILPVVESEDDPPS